MAQSDSVSAYRAGQVAGELLADTEPTDALEDELRETARIAVELAHTPSGRWYAAFTLGVVRGYRHVNRYVTPKIGGTR